MYEEWRKDCPERGWDNSGTGIGIGIGIVEKYCKSAKKLVERIK